MSYSKRSMRRAVGALGLLVACSAVVASLTGGASASDSPIPHFKVLTAVRPLPSTSSPVPASGTPHLKTWSSSVSVGGTNYPFKMVGKKVTTALGSPSTTVTVPVIPLIIKIGTNTFDPTHLLSGCETATAQTRFKRSPIFDKSTTFTMNGVNEGATQYVDAFQRAEFDKFTKASGINPGYHVLLKYVQEPAITVTVPAGDGTTFGSGCSLLGAVEINYFDAFVQNTLFPQVEASDGVNPAKFPLFLTRSVVWFDTVTSNCCILGYHGAFNNPDFGGTPQTYSPTDMELSGEFGGGIEDTSVAAHEVGEWMDDPWGNNPTPLWGHIGQVSGCQGNLEVGDPLTGTNFPDVIVNGYTYHLQELAFFSWFYHQSPSWGAGGKFSNNGTFTTFAANCP